ncbi:hypothetical protein V0288_06375 [Pannus brasiliensis CCIBt3594]|uniref:Uncharacterized protein n=1 Tax=Pannus brasiliensis CCIBt3594 TaxID=1427578 RepID=A0AAW9QG49_9CHRO
MGRDCKKNFSELSPVKWKTLGEITKELEFILREGGGYVTTYRKPDIVYFSFQNEHYFVTYSSPGYTLGKRDSLNHIVWKNIGVQKTGTSYGTAMELVLAVGIHKFQFGISHNGGD